MILSSQILRTSVRWSILVNQFRSISQSTSKPDPTKIKCDYIGPVDAVSNLRQHVRYIPATETSTQRKLRELRTAVDESNQRFWETHNKAFYKAKDAFITQQRKLNGDGEVPADKMSEFYKKFLDENHKRHVTYNGVWYKQNFQIIMLAFQVELENLFRRAMSNK